jgi:hypothetical protein
MTGGRPRAIALTEKGERFVDMMRAGRLSSSPDLFGLCGVCQRYRRVTATDIVIEHILSGRACAGTGTKAVAS